ncbi:MAG: alanine racemase [Terracidiphilus sp.]|jgi:alanine racemase
MNTRPCWVEVCTRSLEDNFKFLNSLAAGEAELLAVVKANAYGHGLELCAPALARAGARWLGVTSVEEGAAARSLCGEARVLVMGGVFRGQGAEVVRERLTPVVWETWQLDELEGAARAAGVVDGLGVHLEIDTGMSRQGVDAEGLKAALVRFGAGSALKLEGVTTHLFAADEADGRVCGEQLARLDEALRTIEGVGLHAEWLNVGSSAVLLAGGADAIGALAREHGMKALMRPGLALYGLAPRFEPGFEAGEEPECLAAARASLKPVLCWKSAVVGVRTVPAGAVVGYNGTFVATEPMQLALVAVGYADGLDRRLGNRFSLLVRGQRAPLVGRVSMDQAVLDVTEIDGVEAGDEVVIVGTQGNEAISAYDHADAARTIPWEVFTRIGARVGRRGIGNSE